MRVLALLIGVLPAWCPSATAQRVILNPGFLVGIGGKSSATPAGALELRVDVGMPWGALSAGYERVGVVQMCEDSLPPDCAPDTSGGHVMYLGISRKREEERGVKRVVGLDAGVARFLKESDTDHRTYLTLGARAGLEIPVGSGLLNLGVAFAWTPVVSTGGLTFGFGIPLYSG